MDVDAALGGVIGDRQTAAEDNDADDEDGRGGVGHAIVKGDRSADRLQGQERDRAQSGVGDPGGGPAPRAFGREAQRVVFQRLVGNPLIVLAPDAVYPLPPCPFCTPDPAGKPDSKTYVAILRCNIRDLAYLCTAQFQQSSTPPITRPRPAMRPTCHTTTHRGSS